jgi:phosphoribosylamine--glycine ligase
MATKIYAAPGNPGTAREGENVDLSADDLEGLVDFAKRNSIDLTVVGPEAPLVAGIVDRFQEAGLRIFGPTAASARLEGSKDFAKKFMAEFGIPTAGSETFDSLAPALAYVERKGAPIVIKADGLAAGKGVTVARDPDAAAIALRGCFEDRVFGQAGARVVIEDCLEGEEASVLAVCDGKTFVTLPSSQDHKPVYDDDQGPNTGGMGAYSPAPVLAPEIMRQVEDEILRPAVEGMAKRGTPYVGVLYAGLMIGSEGPKVIEFNCRLGDPETQAALPVLENDLLELILAATEGNLANAGPVLGSLRPAVCVVLASGGYPGPYEKGIPIQGLESLMDDPDIVVFHAGTKQLEDGTIVTAGGRVLGITARGDTIGDAIANAYRAVGKVSFEGFHFRKDIGRKALRTP